MKDDKIKCEIILLRYKKCVKVLNIILPYCVYILFLIFRCQFCDERFQLLIALQSHERRHKTKTNESTSLGKLQQSNDKHERHKTITKTQTQQNNEQELSEQDTSLTADKAVPIDIEDQEIVNNFYFCPFCDETFDDFEIFHLHTKAHSNDNCLPENQNDVSNKGKGLVVVVGDKFCFSWSL